jgi:hypothetical protein
VKLPPECKGIDGMNELAALNRMLAVVFSYGPSKEKKKKKKKAVRAKKLKANGKSTA